VCNACLYKGINGIFTVKSRDVHLAGGVHAFRSFFMSQTVKKGQPTEQQVYPLIIPQLTLRE
jgi:hypothetical protein